MLRSGRCEVLGVEETPELSFVARSSELEMVSVVGLPDQNAIQKAVVLNGGSGLVLAGVDAREHISEALPNWRGELATLHLLGDSSRLPKVTAGSVRFLTQDELSRSSHIPAALREELIAASRRSSIVAAIADGIPVSFCYAGAVTEGLWDISIDTLIEHRNRGYASVCVAFLSDHMLKSGKRPVWGAEHGNIPSIKLAERLGFVPVDQILVFQRSGRPAFA